MNAARGGSVYSRTLRARIFPWFLVVAACGGGGGGSADPSDPGGGTSPPPGTTATSSTPGTPPPPAPAHLGVAVAKSVALRRGTTLKLPVTLVRTSLPGVVTLDVSGLPAGVTVAPVTVPDGATTASLVFSTAETAPLGKSLLTLHARSKSDAAVAVDTPIEATVYDVEQLDPSFGTGGVVTYTTGTRSFFARGLAVLADSTIVVAGDFDSYQGSPGKPTAAFVRFDVNGAVDNAFGTSGVVSPAASSFGGYDETLARGVVSDGAGGLVGLIEAFKTGSSTTTDTLLVAIAPSGALDPTFGTGGVVKIDLGDRDYDGTLVRDQSGHYLVLGTVETAGGGRDAVITRFTAKGAIDTTYGTAGRLRTTFAGEKPYGFHAAALGDALVLTGSRYQTGSNTIHGFAAKVTSAGALDATFGTGGVYDNTYQVLDFDVASDGLAYLENSSTVWRLLASGAPDTSWAADGKAPYDGSGLHGVPLAAAAGRHYRLRSDTGQPRMELRAYGNDGKVEPAFAGTGSIVVAPPGQYPDPDATALVYAPDGRAVGLGNRFGAQGFITLARFLL